MSATPMPPPAGADPLPDGAGASALPGAAVAPGRAHDPGPERLRFARPARPEVAVIVVGYRAAPYLIDCLRALWRNRPDADFEVVIFLNAPTDELRQEVDHSVQGAVVRESRVNIGFGAACNLGAAATSAEHLLLLNDDAEVEAGWLDALLDMARSRGNVGAVGSRVLDVHGVLQEAGNVLWSDGTTATVGDGVGVPGDDFDWARQVDFCSGASLLVPRAVWQQVGGFDEDYFPAYYEDVDLCLKIKALGLEVWYQPLSVVRHIRSASTSTRLRDHLIARNRVTLRNKWGEELRTRAAWDVSVPAVDRAIWLAMGRPQRVLIIDDRIPDGALGSGYGRMVDTIRQLAGDQELHVAFFAALFPGGDRSSLSRLGVRVISGDLADHLSAPSVRYDTIIVSRPHNYETVGHLLRTLQPDAEIVYDAEALYYRRLERQRAYASSDTEVRSLTERTDAMRALERRIVDEADVVVAIADEEAALIRALGGDADIRVVPPNLATPAPTPNGYRSRSDLVMVAGWQGGMVSPNADGLLWFLRHVFPLVRARVPWARLKVTGIAPPPELRVLESPSVRFVGRVEDLADLYGSARAAIVPTRYGAGVKLKTIEALQFGVPVVSTSVGAEGVDTGTLFPMFVTDDATQFADAVAALLDDRQAWERARHTLDELNDWWSRTMPASPWLDIVRLDRRRPRPSATDGGRRP